MKYQLMLCLAALTSSAAYAQDQARAAPAPDSSTSSIFMQLDTNKDGHISSAEAQASTVVSTSFASADKNGDGGITREEFASSFTMRSPNTPPPTAPQSPNP